MCQRLPKPQVRVQNTDISVTNKRTEQDLCNKGSEPGNTYTKRKRVYMTGL